MWSPPFSSNYPQAIARPQDLVEKGRVLDNFHIPAPYPNSHPEGAPFEHYGG